MHRNILKRAVMAVLAAASTGQRNALIFMERWSEPNEESSLSTLHIKKVSDLASLATPSIDEFDWTLV
jgi:hypothetical protein